MSIFPKITADQIAQWAAREGADAILPELLRRLIYASGATVRSIWAPVGANTNVGGYDLRLDVVEERSHVPAGGSVWEMGVGEGVLKKLDEDYDKRTAKPLGVDPARTVYIAVTARKFPVSRKSAENPQKLHYASHQDWAASKAGGPWREVRVVDAGVLEGWLAEAPAVASWFAREHLGEEARGVADAAHYLASRRPARARTPWALGRLVCAGREEDVEQVQRWAAGPPKQLRLRGERWEEAALCTAAALLHQPWARQGELEGRVLAITTQEAWQHYTQPGAAPNAVLIAAFPGASRHALPAPTHIHTLIPVGSGPEDAGARPLRSPRAEALARALVAWFGLGERKANEVVQGAGRSVMGVLRWLDAEPAPAWVSTPDAHKLLPALLVGQWSIERWGEQARYRDAEVFAMFPGLGSLDVLMHTVIPTVFGADSPIEDVPDWGGRNVVRWRGRDDAWQFLGSQLPLVEAQWARVIELVYATPNAAFDLPAAERVFAPLREGLERGFSAALRMGLAQGMARYAQENDRNARFVQGLVRRILDTMDWRRWATFGEVLPIFAEAAPGAFLDALEATLCVPSRLVPLFEVGDGFGARHEGHGVLSALKLVAWWSEHTPRAARVLIDLTKIAGASAGAMEALAGVFNPWAPQTTADAQTRGALLDEIAADEPQLVWSLRLGWLQKTRGGIVHRHERPSSLEEEQGEGVTRGEIAEAFRVIVAGLLEQAGTDGARWRTLMEEPSQFWRAGQHEAFVSALRERVEVLRQDEAFMWTWRKALNTRFSYRRRDEDNELPDAAFWDELLALYQAHEPSEVLQRRWLFEHHRLEDPEGDLEDWNKEEERCQKRRDDVVRALWVSGEFEAFVLGLDVSDVGGEELVATSLALVIDEAEVGAALVLNIPAERAESFWARFFWPLGSRAEQRGELFQWFERMLLLIEAQEEVRREAMMAGLVRRLPLSEETFRYLGEPEREALRVRYWQFVPLLGGLPRAVPATVMLTVCTSCLNAGRLGDVLQYLETYNEEWQQWGEQSQSDVLSLFQRVMNEALAAGVAVLSKHRWGLKELHRYVFESGNYEPAWLARWEFFALGLVSEIGDSRETYLELFRQLERDPTFFVKVLSYWTRGDDVAEEANEHQLMLADRAYEVFVYWNTRPGRGEITLADWVERALSIAAETGRAQIAASKIGEALANGESGADGVWPDEEVRAVLEVHAEDEALCRGFLIGVTNRRGSSVRVVSDGGAQEYKLAEQYEQWANTLIRHRTTARLLRKVAQRYREEGEREDARAAFERMNQSFQLHSAQEGFFTRVQAEQAGLRGIEGLVESGVIERVYDDVYRVKDVQQVLSDSRSEALIPVWLWSGREGVFCDRTALNLLNLSNDSPERIYILLDNSQRELGLRVPEGVEVFYGPRPQPAEIAWFEGRLPCTNAARTLNDCASRHVDVEELTRAIHNGLRAGLFTEDEIAPALAYTHYFEEEAS